VHNFFILEEGREREKYVSYYDNWLLPTLAEMD
jgi:hypothetical protein